MKYEDVTRLLVGVQSRWDRRSKGSSGNLRNIDDIANFFEVPLRTEFSAAVRKTGPDGRFIYAGDEARTGLLGHVFVHGPSIDMDLVLSSCIRREGFGWSVEMAETRFLSGVSHVGFAWEDTLVIVDVGSAEISGAPYSQRDGNVKFDLKAICDHVSHVIRVDGSQIVTPSGVKVMTAVPSRSFQDFRLRGRSNVHEVKVVELKSRTSRTYICKKSLWNSMVGNGYTKTYENFRMMIGRESTRMMDGTMSQRPTVLSCLYGPGREFVVVDSSVPDTVVGRYLDDLESRRNSVATSRRDFLRRKAWSGSPGSTINPEG